MSSSSSLEREIDEYQDVFLGVRVVVRVGKVAQPVVILQIGIIRLGFLVFPFEEFQELQHRMASGSGASSSRQPPSPPRDEEEDEENVIYSCALEVASTLDAAKLKTLVDRY